MSPQDQVSANRWLRQEMIPLDMLRPSPFQPRIITLEAMEKMSESLKRVGQLHAIAARQISPVLYEICGGHCRYFGAQAAGWETIRADIFDFDDDQAFMAVMEENHSRSDLLPLEEAKICAEALARFPAETVAAKLGHSEAWVRRRAHLNNLHPCWKHLVCNTEHRNTLTIAHLEAVAKLDQSAQETFLEKNEKRLPFMSPKDLRSVISAMATPFCPPWPQDAFLADLDPCSACSNRTSCTPSLPGLDLDEEGDHCLDAECYEAKYAAWYTTALRDFVEQLPDYKREFCGYAVNPYGTGSALRSFSKACIAMGIKQIWHLGNKTESVLEPVSADWASGRYTQLIEINDAGEICGRVMEEAEAEEDQDKKDEYQAERKRIAALHGNARKDIYDLLADDFLSKIQQGMKVDLMPTRKLALAAMLVQNDDPDARRFVPGYLLPEGDIEDAGNFIDLANNMPQDTMVDWSNLLLPLLLSQYIGRFADEASADKRLRQAYELVVAGCDYDAAKAAAQVQVEENKRLLAEG
jgi:ParB/RepB/Spo0J family partition protein